MDVKDSYFVLGKSWISRFNSRSNVRFYFATRAHKEVFPYASKYSNLKVTDRPRKYAAVHRRHISLLFFLFTRMWHLRNNAAADPLRKMHTIIALSLSKRERTTRRVPRCGCSMKEVS